MRVVYSNSELPSALKSSSSIMSRGVTAYLRQRQIYSQITEDCIEHMASYAIIKIFKHDCVICFHFCHHQCQEKGCIFWKLREYVDSSD